MKHRAVTVSVNRQTLGYVRVSSDDQVRDGVSLDAQRARIAAYCVAMGWPVSEVVCDAGRSAKSLERPGMAKILEAVRIGTVERVIVTKLDRLTRSTRDLADLLDLLAKHDVALISIGETLDTSSAGGRLVVNMLGVVGQWEREAIAERTAAALSHKRQKRLAYGRTPFGFVRVGSALFEHPVKQSSASTIVKTRVSFSLGLAVLTLGRAQNDGAVSDSCNVSITSASASTPEANQPPALRTEYSLCSVAWRLRSRATLSLNLGSLAASATRDSSSGPRVATIFCHCR